VTCCPIPSDVRPLGKKGAPKGNQNAAKGRPSKNGYNVTSLPRRTGNSRAYTLDRLKRERPDLFERVARKELSANAAAIEAGFRRARHYASIAITRLGRNMSVLP
jgi:hypothetical protein